MEIVAPPESTLLSLWSFQAFISSFCPNLFHSKTVALLACPYQESESLSFKQASAQNIFAFNPDPWSWITKIWSHRITFSNTSYQPFFARCTWFGVFHANTPHPLQPHQQLIDGPLSQVHQWRFWCGWHCVRSSWKCNILLQISLHPQQCIVNRVTKGTHSNRSRGRNTYLHYLQYTIWSVTIRFIVGSRGNMCGYGGNRSVVSNGYGCRQSGGGSGGHINGSKRRGYARSFPHRGWWGYLIKFWGGRDLMDVYSIFLSLYLLDTIFHHNICRYLYTVY